MAREINNLEDIIDSRDVIERIEELEAELEELTDAVDDAETPDEQDEAAEALADFDDSELIALQDLANEAEGYALDWHHGETLVRETYFTEYAQQLAEDIGAVDSDASWPNTYIDWEAAAEALLMDYTAVDFDGVTYYVR